jgi:anaerobic selenocysteine-containing dehydrogenase
MAETHRTFCRFCHALCGLEVDVEAGRAVAVRPDPANAMSRGYICVKGRQLLDQHYGPGRLRGSFRREADGRYAPIASEGALDEIAEQLGQLIARHGPESIAVYSGTHGLFSTARTLIISWVQAIGTPWYFTPNTIDQPSRHIAWARHGTWHAGTQRWADADVMLFVGNNPGVSAFSQDGGPQYADGFRVIREAQARGLRVIAIDPRRSELARRSDLHLAVRPGEDPTLLAGITRVILEEGLYDKDFAGAYVSGVDALRAALRAYTPDYVEARTGVPAAQVEAAARLFARGPRGTAIAGTGVNMAPRPDVTQHFVIALNSLCGRFAREGDPIRNPGTLLPAAPRHAEVRPPRALWGKGHRSRFRGLGQFMSEMPINVFADEILTAGPGQIRALINVGGNPAVAFPDQRRVVEALRALELCVSLDVSWTASARLSHYEIGCKLSLEKPGTTQTADLQFAEPFAQYTPALVAPEADVVEEWEFFHGLARRMGTPVRVGRQPLDLERKPSSEEFLDLLHAGSRVPLDEVRQHPGGALFPPDEPACVRPPRPERAGARFDVAPADVLRQLERIRAEDFSGAGGYGGDARFAFRLISRRMIEVYNSTGEHLAGLRKRWPYNPAFMHPTCLAQLGLRAGDVVRIDSDHDFILGVVQPSDDVPAGVVSMAHSRGDVPGRDAEVREIGSTTNRLVSVERDFEPLSGIPRQSAIPVNVRALRPGEFLPV